MKYPAAYVSFLVHFHGDRDYFECHEILEEYWKEVDPRNRESHWVGLIQLAVALYHGRRGNVRGAVRIMAKSQRNLAKQKGELQQLGLHVDELFNLLAQTEERLVAYKPFQHINLPMIDDQLVKQCITACNEVGFTWCSTLPVVNHSILNKHPIRDRTDVMLERQRQLDRRSSKNRG